MGTPGGAEGSGARSVGPRGAGGGFASQGPRGKLPPELGEGRAEGTGPGLDGGLQPQAQLCAPASEGFLPSPAGDKKREACFEFEFPEADPSCSERLRSDGGSFIASVSCSDLRACQGLSDLQNEILIIIYGIICLRM